MLHSKIVTIELKQFIPKQSRAMANETRKPLNRLLDRISQVLFGLIMLPTSTATLNVVNAGRVEIQTMIIGALGCNLTWGIIDAGIYLMGCLSERGHNFLMLRAIREATSPGEVRRVIADLLPLPLASVMSQEELGSMQQKLLQLPEPPASAGLTKEDAVSAVGVCLLVVLSTFPVVIPFLFIGEVQLALRISNAVAIAMMFLCGYTFARCTGYRPWPTGLAMVAIGSVLTGVAIALGG